MGGKEAKEITLIYTEGELQVKGPHCWQLWDTPRPGASEQQGWGDRWERLGPGSTPILVPGAQGGVFSCCLEASLKKVCDSAYFVPKRKKVINIHPASASADFATPGSFASLSLLWCRGPLGLPQVVVDGERVHTDRHGLGRDEAELLPVRAVLVQLVDHLLGDALGPGARQLADLLGVGIVAVESPELAAGVPEQDDVVVGITLLQLLRAGHEAGRHGV